MADLPRHPVLRRNQNLTVIVKDYFGKGDTYLEMVEFLKVHNKNNWFKRFLKKMNCFRRPLLGRKINLMRSKNCTR